MGEFLTPLLQLTIAKLPGDEDKHLHMYEKSQLYQCCVEKLKFRGKPTAADTVQRLWTGVLTVFGLQHREKGLWEGKMCSESSHASQGEGEMREGWKGMFWSRIKGGERNREGSESSPRDSWETNRLSWWLSGRWQSLSLWVQYCVQAVALLHFGAHLTLYPSKVTRRRVLRCFHSDGDKFFHCPLSR